MPDDLVCDSMPLYLLTAALGLDPSGDGMEVATYGAPGETSLDFRPPGLEMGLFWKKGFSTIA